MEFESPTELRLTNQRNSRHCSLGEHLLKEIGSTPCYQDNIADLSVDGYCLGFKSPSPPSASSLVVIGKRSQGGSCDHNPIVGHLLYVLRWLSCCRDSYNQQKMLIMVVMVSARKIKNSIWKDDLLWKLAEFSLGWLSI